MFDPLGLVISDIFRYFLTHFKLALQLAYIILEFQSIILV